MLDPVLVFISYASEDSDIRKELETHLAVLQRDGTISIGSDQSVNAGVEWAPEIRDRVAKAHIILLLVSAHFVASDWCYEQEMRDALHRHDDGSAVVIPIIIRQCDWETAPFAKLQALPRDHKAVTMRGPKKNDIWRDIVKEIREVAARFRHAQKLAASSLTVRGPAALDNTPSSYLATDHFHITRSAKDPLFVIPGKEADAVRIVRDSSVSLPSREISVVPLALRHGLLSEDLGFLAQHWQVPSPRNEFFFPDFDLRNSAIRIAGGVRWVSEAGREHDRRFSLANDGSIAASEFASESILHDRSHRLRCINIFPCLDRYLGALLFTRYVAEHCKDFRQAWIILTLKLIGGEHLVYDDGAGYSTDPAADQFIASDKLIRVGGYFDTQINDEDLAKFSVGMALAVSARFGCDHRSAELSAYVEDHLPTLLLARLARRSR